MNRKLIVIGMLAFLASSGTVVFAETEKTPVPSEKVGERPRDLTKEEAPSPSPSSKMMKHEPGMKHDHEKMEKGMDTNHSMGQMPEQNSDKSGAVKQPTESAPAGDKMSPGEMGKM